MKMNFHMYQFMHFMGALFFISAMAITFYKEGKSLWFKIFYSAMAILILVTGILLSFKVGIQNFKVWPIWIKYKIFGWCVLTIVFPIINKVLPKYKKYYFWAMIPFLWLIVYSAVYKPF